MKIAIEYREGAFTERFVEYCDRHGIDYKLVDCRSNDIVKQLEDCDALMWHWPHANHTHELFARQLTYSLECVGKVVFPDANTCWHFDDKIGQKYLFEATGLPLVPSWVFYDREQALEWIEQAEFPLVFKLSGGAGSQNVRLLHSRAQARRLVKKMFAGGLLAFDILHLAFDRLRKWRHKKDTLRSVLSTFKAWFCSLFRHRDREYGYVYFQKFIPDNKFDIRCIVIGDKVFEIKRMCRDNDFRASGSGNILYEKEELSEDCAAISFQVAKKLKTQVIALDFVFDHGTPLIVEASYGFAMHGYDRCTGYWDNAMIWHEGAFIPQDWMIEEVIAQIRNGKNNL